MGQRAVPAPLRVELVKPIGDREGRREGIGRNALDFTLLEIGAQGAAAEKRTALGIERAQVDRRVEALVFVERGLLPVVSPVVEQGQAGGEAAGHDDLVDVKLLAVRFVGTEAGDDAVAVGERCLAHRGVHDATGVADARQNGVGAAADGEGFEVEGVSGDVGSEEVSGARGLGEGAHAVDRGRIVAHLCRVFSGDAREISPLAGDFRRGGVSENVLELGDADILKEFLGVDRDGGADVLDIGVEARPGERAGGAVADVAFGADDERAEFDHFRFRDRRTGSRSIDGSG